MARKPFKFKCTACGRCCQWGGWVCLYPEDVRRLAQFFNQSLQSFVDQYTKHVAVEFHSNRESIVIPYLALKPGKTGCIFLVDKLCTVHEQKPVHCKASPLLAEFLLDQEGWEKFTTECEGVGQGPVITRPEIDKALQEQAERDMAYEAALEEAGWNLGQLLGVTLPEPEILPDFGMEVEIEE